MATTPPPEREAEFQCGVLLFLREGAIRAAGTLRGRTFERVERLCRQHFCGITPTHAFERVDWRVVHELFTFIWNHASTKNCPAWAAFGEDLYAQMGYLYGGPMPPSGGDVRVAPDNRSA